MSELKLGVIVGSNRRESINRKLAQALGVTIKHNGLPLDRPPFELRARAEKPEIVVGPRIGITKAVDEPWRYGLKGSRFLSKGFK